MKQSSHCSHLSKVLWHFHTFDLFRISLECLCWDESPLISSDTLLVNWNINICAPPLKLSSCCLNNKTNKYTADDVIMTRFFMFRVMLQLHAHVCTKESRQHLMKHATFYWMKTFIMTYLCCFAYFTWHHAPLWPRSRSGGGDLTSLWSGDII